MTLGDFLTQVKAEARLDGDTGFDDMFVGWLNEAMLEAAMQQETPELAGVDSLAFDTNGDGEVALPADFLKVNRVRFFTTEGNSWRLHDKEGSVPPAPIGFYGYPKSYIIRGENIQIEPEAEVDSGDSLEFEYYKRPATFDAGTEATEIIPVRLIPYVTKVVVARAMIWHEKLEAAQQIISLTGNSATGSIDENQPKQDPE